MCTVSWLHQDDGYQLFCNRDERKARAIARGPEVIDSGAVRFIAPIDRAEGGTWIAVNEHGISLCLLNGSGLRPEKRECPFKSRGHIVMELATATCVAEACDRGWQASLLEFAPFRLVLMERGRPTVVMTWDGTSRSIASHGSAPLSSSSVDDTGAQRAREREFRRVMRRFRAIDAEAHMEFHRSHGARASAYSPCMHRPDAETVSFTRVQVASSEVVVEYTAASPCLQYPAQIRRLCIAS
jgi:Transport and Golgi organisation 2